MIETAMTAEENMQSANVLENMLVELLSMTFPGLIVLHDLSSFSIVKSDFKGSFIDVSGTMSASVVSSGTISASVVSSGTISASVVSVIFVPKRNAC